MNIKLIIIDEPIKINSDHNSKALNLWQKTLWAKAKNYSLHYKNSILPIGVDDFFGAHLVVAEELEDGNLEPIIMFKSVPMHRFKKYHTDLSLNKTLKETNFKDSIIIKKFMNSDKNVSYYSSFTFNGKYLKHPSRNIFKEYISVLSHAYTNYYGIKEWISIAATKYKVDKFFEFNGAKKIHDEFCVKASDYEPVQLYHHNNTDIVPEKVNELIKKHQTLINEINIYSPNGIEFYNQKHKTKSVA